MMLKRVIGWILVSPVVAILLIGVGYLLVVCPIVTAIALGLITCLVCGVVMIVD